MLGHTLGKLHSIQFFRILFFFLFFYITVEHSASVLTGIIKAIPCSTGGLDIFRAYFSMSFRQVFTLINYSLVIAIPLGFLNLMLACAWNYMDLFIIILACALSDKFKQLNQKLASVKGKVSHNILSKSINRYLLPRLCLDICNM